MNINSKATKQQLVALARLNTEEFKAFLDLLDVLQRELYNALTYLNDVNYILRYQGRVQMILDLQEAIKTARDTLDKS